MWEEEEERGGRGRIKGGALIQISTCKHGLGCSRNGPMTEFA